MQDPSSCGIYNYCTVVRMLARLFWRTKAIVPAPCQNWHLRRDLWKSLREVMSWEAKSWVKWSGVNNILKILQTNLSGIEVVWINIKTQN